MRGFIVVLLLALLGLNAYQVWQVRQLQIQNAALEARVSALEADKLASNSFYSTALQNLLRAREALNNTDTQAARDALARATDEIGKASRTMGEKAGPSLKSLRDQADSLRTEIETRIKR